MKPEGEGTLFQAIVKDLHANSLRDFYYRFGRQVGIFRTYVPEERIQGLIAGGRAPRARVSRTPVYTDTLAFQRMAFYRMILEPLGANVDGWSSSLDGGLYTMADRLAYTYEYGPSTGFVPFNLELAFNQLSEGVLERLETALGARPTADFGSTPNVEACATLSARLLTEFERDRVALLAAYERGESEIPRAFQAPPALERSAGELAAIRPLEELRRRAIPVLASKCLECHSARGPALKIPFGDAVAFEAELVASRDLESRAVEIAQATVYRPPGEPDALLATPMKDRGLARAIWSRISRPPTQNGHMPLNGKLKDEQKILIKAYLDGVVSP